MRLAEKLLLLFSRPPGSNDYQTDTEWNFENALSILCSVFPNFMSVIVGKEILDYGCGTGYQALALAKNGAKYVLGIDINQNALERARYKCRELGLQQQVAFADKLDDRFKGKFDIVISQNSMEHFRDPIKILDNMKMALNNNGTIMITFGPPWFAPYGSHTDFFTKLPWVNIMFSEKTVMNVRANFRNEAATRYEEIKGGLNKMAIAKFERIISNSGMKIRYLKYGCVKGINFLGKLPCIRELFINGVNCVLSRH